MSAKLFGGEEVKILTSGGEIDPSIYNVQFVKRDLVGLLNKETGITIKVNNKRIYKIIKEKIMNNNDNNNTAVMDESTMTITPVDLTVEQDKNEMAPEKEKKAKKAKTPPQPINFDKMVEDGYEVWTKGGLSLGEEPKISEIQVSAHCVIGHFFNEGDRLVEGVDEGEEFEGYEVFNSYNGTRGAKGKGGKRYKFTEKMTIEKKRKSLAKKGYVQHTIDS